MITIRDILPEEIKKIHQLVVALAIFEKEPDAVHATVEDYRNAHSEGLLHILVAVDDDNIIGMAICYMTFSTWRGKMFYLEDFYVKDSYRSKGVGQQLFDEYIKRAKDLKCSMVKWQVLDWNEGAIKFYKKNGATIEKQWYNGKIIF